MRAGVAIAAALLALCVAAAPTTARRGRCWFSFSLPVGAAGRLVARHQPLARRRDVKPIPNTLQLRKGLREGSVEIDFPHNYIAGDSLEVELTITDGDGEAGGRAAAFRSSSLPSAALSTIALDGDADGGSDGSFGDGSDAPSRSRRRSPRSALLACRPSPPTDSVTWAVSEPNGGTIDHSGVYIAPSKVGTYHVVGTSSDGQTASATQ